MQGIKLPVTMEKGASCQVTDRASTQQQILFSNGVSRSWTPDYADLIPMVETFLKFNVSSVSISERSGRQPPSNEQPLQPMATVPGFLVTMAILLLDRWLQTPPHPPPPPRPPPPSPPSCCTTPLDSFVLPATTTTNQSRTAKKYSITRQELEGGSGGGSGGVGSDVEDSKFFETTLGYFRRLKTIKSFVEKRYLRMNRPVDYLKETSRGQGHEASGLLELGSRFEPL
ncbi:hypothetical protein HZH66_002218 [Vespula vulgaris]|uniref:Uncharacterized protein n=1 Tax=Vespula vulgaris TaxID=7454 RepID=A0A834KKR6_VESVU|nr:hypothetical protein HZH66_002218 [Vespula vulgaris]